MESLLLHYSNLSKKLKNENFQPYDLVLVTNVVTQSMFLFLLKRLIEELTISTLGHWGAVNLVGLLLRCGCLKPLRYQNHFYFCQSTILSYITLQEIKGVILGWCLLLKAGSSYQFEDSLCLQNILDWGANEYSEFLSWSRILSWGMTFSK